MSVIGVHLAACAVLVVAGAAKLARPDELAVALARWSRMSRATASVAVRAMAAIEVVLGIAAIARPAGIAAALVALSYVGFTAYVVALRRAGGALSSCGCFGEPDTPATRAHAAVTALFAVAAGAVAARGDDSLLAVLEAQPGHGAPLVLASGVVGLLAIVVLTRHAEVHAVRALYESDAA